MTDDEHIVKITELRCKLSREFSDILNNHCLRFGRAQKMLNLYLKHLWVRGCIKTPPHCPFDRGILIELGIQVAWTHMNDINEYRRWVDAAREAAKEEGHRSIAEWELKKWNG